MKFGIVLRGVQHGFSSGQWLWRLNRTIQASLAVVGPNGSGKSTLLAVLAGVLRPAVGELTFVWEGQTTKPDCWRVQIAWLSPHLYPPLELTVADVVKMYKTYKGLVDSPEGLLERLDLMTHCHQALYRLSSGQRQRLLLGLALFGTSPVILLDEPTAFLDAFWREVFQAHLQALLAERLVICATNDPYEAQLFPQKLYLGQHGAAA